MTSEPTLLRGVKAIAEHLSIGPRLVQAMHQQGRLPTFRVGGTPYATAGALDEWRTLYRAGKTPDG